MNRLCDVCGKEIIKEQNKSRNKHKFCSKKCYLTFIHLSKVKLICNVCKKNFEVSPSFKNKKHCSRKCAGLEKMERKMSIDGYWVIHKIGYYKNEVKEHRWMMEQKIGRRLSPNEIVHHLNFDKLDNRIENLVIVSRGEHNIIHQPNGFNPNRRFK